MANPSLFSLALCVSLFALTTTLSEKIRIPYIIHMNKSMKPLHFPLHEHWYASLISEATSGSDDEGLLLYAYDIVVHGFAAKLSSAEAAALESMEGCLAVIPSSVTKIQTTHSPQFLGLSGSHNNLWPRSHYGKDVIVGVIDTGIWPESDSFNDRGLGPVPAKWKGVCQRGEMFNSSHCNRKIIGARYFFKGFEARYGKLSKSEIKSARDTKGHGTHCASTAAGSAVDGASFNGFGNGTAIGMAPQARLAVYKVLWANGAGDTSDIVAGMEMAISDGVDILSMSLGPKVVHVHQDTLCLELDMPFYMDLKAIAAFKAMEKGMFVSFAAGNEGPLPFSVSGTAPWVTTVGAGSMDRRFPATVTLGNLETHRASSSISKASQISPPLALVYVSHNESTRKCSSLHPDMVKGKIVLCDYLISNPYFNSAFNGTHSKEAVGEVKAAGGAAVILANDIWQGAEEFDVADYDLPTITVSFEVGRKIKAYIKSTSKPTAVIKQTGLAVVGKAIRAPIVPAFSSRGPSLEFPDILKPDVVAPGLNILAASTEGKYMFMSGTSMACPHVSGIAALIRSVHPSWSPAAIKSALMTSAYVSDNDNQPITDAWTVEAADPFPLGAGHVNPAAAVDPGLVYDLAPRDYIRFLCTLKDAAKHVGLLMPNQKSPCSNSGNLKDAGDLNYPSFSIVLNSNSSARQVVVRRRTVTNVGAARSTYKVHVVEPFGIKISVQPETLEFAKKNQKLNFRVRFESDIINKDFETRSGEISWKCVRGGTHVVRSPIAVLWQGKCQHGFPW